MISESCFICQPKTGQQLTETPFQWVETRTACQLCSEQLQLQSGELLLSFMNRYESASGYGLEGSGLNPVINPVTLHGIRGWLEFFAGSWAVNEEVFPSKNYTEFWIQHVPKYLDTLYRLYEQRSDFTNNYSIELFAKFVSNPPDADAMGSMFRGLDQARQIKNRLENLGKNYPESPNEAVSLIRGLSLNLETAEKGYIQKYILELLEIAKSRFSHLLNKKPFALTIAAVEKEFGAPEYERLRQIVLASLECDDSDYPPILYSRNPEASLFEDFHFGWDQEPYEKMRAVREVFSKELEKAPSPSIHDTLP